MPSLVAVAISLALFFALVFYFCVRDLPQDADARSDSEIDMMRKSPFGCWR
jgi:hypothetical protein